MQFDHDVRNIPSHLHVRNDGYPASMQRPLSLPKRHLSGHCTTDTSCHKRTKCTAANRITSRALVTFSRTFARQTYWDKKHKCYLLRRL
jgi:hypothetical protein